MRSLGVVVEEPGIEIGLQRLDGLVECLSHLHPEELVEDGAVEALDEAVGLRRADLGSSVLNAVQIEVELVGVAVRPGFQGWSWVNLRDRSAESLSLDLQTRHGESRRTLTLYRGTCSS